MLFAESGYDFVPVSITTVIHLTNPVRWFHSMSHNKLSCFTFLPFPDWLRRIQVWVFHIAHGKLMYANITETYNLVINDFVFRLLVLLVFGVLVACC